MKREVAHSPDPSRILAYFGPDLPETAGGALAFIGALEAKGRHADAVAEATKAWTELPFTADQQTQILAAYAGDLKVAHEVRLDRILWEGGRADEAERMLPLVSKAWGTLAAARVALRADKPGVATLVAAVPAPLKDDAGLAYERFLYRMRQNNYADAATLIIERSNSVKRLGDPAAWADKRASLARYLMRNGNEKAAYMVASSHQLTDPKAASDLEFLSGYIALRKLNDPARALKHFGRLMVATTPISQSRALYWMARACEASGDKANRADLLRLPRRRSCRPRITACSPPEKLGLTL